MKHIHPDIVVGEPVPEIEPRVELETLAMMQMCNRRWRLSLLCMLAVYVVFLFTSPSFRVSLLGAAFVFLLFMSPIAGIRKYKKSINEASKNGGKNIARYKWSVPLRVNIEYQGYLCSLGILIQPLINAGDGFSRSFMYVGLLVLLCGVWSIVLGKSARQPGQISCIDCEYPLIGLTIPCGCPECGRMIYDPSWTTDRPRVRSGWFLWGGLAMVLVGASVVYSSFANPGLFYGPMPRSMLMKMASTDREAFERLMLGPLTIEEEQLLIDAMVANQSTSSHSSSFDQGQWITQQIMNGRLSEAQLDLIFMKTAEIEIDGPSSGRVGEMMEFGLKAEYVRMPSFAATPGYYFRGFTIHDDETLESGSDWPRFRLYITKNEFRNEKDVPRFEWIPDAPGTHVIRARIVLALFPGGGRAANIPIDWSQGEDAMFATTPIWSTVIDLEHAIIVEP